MKPFTVKAKHGLSLEEVHQASLARERASTGESFNRMAPDEPATLTILENADGFAAKVIGYNEKEGKI